MFHVNLYGETPLPALVAKVTRQGTGPAMFHVNLYGETPEGPIRGRPGP